jgi:hypothetical protein
MGKFCPYCRPSKNVSIRVNYTAIAAAFTDRGMLAPEIHQLSDIHKRFAVVLSPRRTGKMAGTHYKRVMPARGFGRSYYIGVSAGYAKFVRYGTAGNGNGYIMARPPRLMELRPRPFSWFAPGNPKRFQAVVHGQEEQGNWIGAAGAEAMVWFGLGSSKYPGIANAANLR